MEVVKIVNRYLPRCIHWESFSVHVVLIQTHSIPHAIYKMPIDSICNLFYDTLKRHQVSSTLCYQARF